MTPESHVNHARKIAAVITAPAMAETTCIGVQSAGGRRPSNQRGAGVPGSKTERR